MPVRIISECVTDPQCDVDGGGDIGAALIRGRDHAVSTGHTVEVWDVDRPRGVVALEGDQAPAEARRALAQHRAEAHTAVQKPHPAEAGAS